MFQQIKILTKLELCNIYQLNVFRFNKDAKNKRRMLGLMAAWILVIAVLAFYVGGLSYGLVYLGLSDIVPTYLITISVLLLFFFDIFKAGSIIFAKNGLDALCSMPVSQTAIVVSRFLRIYVENLGFTLMVMLPGLAVYAWLIHPGISFYLLGIFVILIIPLLPVALSTLIGALITGFSSGMKHKSLVASALTLLMIVAIMFGSSRLTAMEDNITMDMLKELSSTVSVLLHKLCPPAAWLGNALISGNFLVCFACFLLFLAVFTAVIGLIAANFQPICRRLYSTSAKHNYRMETLKKDSVMVSLCKREFKRYFASSIYVTNTIVGPIMGVVFCVALLFIDTDRILAQFPIAIDLNGGSACLLAGIFGMMTTTCTSVSLEGKNWWIVKSLPLTTKQILDAKILMSLLLMLPFYLVAEVLLLLALKPGIVEFLWMLLIPAILILFVCVYGITVNLHFPVFNWDNETSVVKQSVSTLLGMAGSLVALICMVPVALVPVAYSHLVKAAICILVLGITAVLYRKNNRRDLRGIG